MAEWQSDACFDAIDDAAVCCHDDSVASNVVDDFTQTLADAGEKCFVVLVAGWKLAGFEIAGIGQLDFVAGHTAPLTSIALSHVRCTKRCVEAEMFCDHIAGRGGSVKGG